jgi:hypothetical protein
MKAIKGIINHYKVSRLVHVSAARCGPSWLYNECWLCVNEMLPLDRTSGDLELRETKEQRNIPSPSFDRMSVHRAQRRVVSIFFQRYDSFGIFVPSQPERMPIGR